MSNLSQFAPFAGGGLKSYQTGYVNTTTATGSGEDAKYLDVSVSSVSTTKTVCGFVGSGNSFDVGYGMAYFQGDNAFQIMSPRMTSSTNLRLSNGRVSNSPGYVQGRWQIAEAN